MRRTSLRALLAAALLTTLLPHAYALWSEVQLTPKNLAFDNLTFTIKTKEVEKLTGFEVTVTPKAGKKLSPLLAARLSIASADTFVGTVPVEEKRAEDGSGRYWFRVSPKFLSHSRFDFDAGNYVEVKGKPPHPKFEQVMGGSSYWFFLRDFAAPAKP
jgi:hypothetical protein